MDQLIGDDTMTLAPSAAEAICGLNHAYRHDAGLGQRSVARGVLGALHLAAARLGQALDQITGYLDRALAAGAEALPSAVASQVAKPATWASAMSSATSSGAGLR